MLFGFAFLRLYRRLQYFPPKGICRRKNIALILWNIDKNNMYVYV